MGIMNSRRFLPTNFLPLRMDTPSSQTQDANPTRSVTDHRSNNDSSNLETHTLKVVDGEDEHIIDAQHGRTLRAVLQEHGLSPHGWLTRHLNCQGQGHCAACTVEVQEGDPDSDQWLDAYLSSQSLGRLSCQIDITEDLTVRVG